MPLRSSAFGEFVREVLRRRKLSHRQVVKLSNDGISHATVAEMKDGVIPNSDKLVEFALAAQVDPNQVFKAAGRPWLRFDLEAYTRATGRPLEHLARTLPNKTCGTELRSDHASQK